MILDRAVLNALAVEIREHPEILQPASAAIVERMRPLVADVDVDLGQPLEAELDDPGMI